MTPEQMTEDELIDGAGKAMVKAAVLPAGSLARSIQWAVYDTCADELARRAAPFLPRLDLDAADAAASALEGTARAKALDALRFHWGDAYEIDYDEELGWWAERRDGLGGRLIAADPEELFRDIQADYALNPVPRQHGRDACDRGDQA
jgi:hypothetical protein